MHFFKLHHKYKVHIFPVKLFGLNISFSSTPDLQGSTFFKLKINSQTWKKIDIFYVQINPKIIFLTTKGFFKNRRFRHKSMKSLIHVFVTRAGNFITRLYIRLKTMV